MLSRSSSLLLSLLSLAGLWVSDLLTLKQVKGALSLSGDDGLCSALEIFSCEAAAQSSFSTLFGLPIASLGGAWYLTALGLTLAIQLERDQRPALTSLLALGALIASLYSLFLGGVSIWLGSLCPYCVILYLINFSSLFLLWRRPDGLAFSQLSQLRGLSFILVSFLSLGSLSAAVGSYTLHRDHVRAKLSNAIAKQQALRYQPISAGDSPQRGDPEAMIELIEFSDFQCPHCRRLAENLDRALREAPGLFRVRFRHFPLNKSCNTRLSRDLHPFACAAARAAICAQAEGKFWPFHDLLFKNQRDLNEASIKSYAAELSLDIDRFERCLSAPETTTKLKADIDAALAAKVGGTPAFFINGWRTGGAKATPLLLKLIREYGLKPPPASSEELTPTTTP
ncbi:MAG: DsbA family protein [Myxococcota bacterium]|nr:DsbA family protein [Myxococcota bacterium]